MLAKPFTGPTLGMGFSRPPQFGSGIVYYVKEPGTVIAPPVKAEEGHGIAQYMVGLVREFLGEEPHEPK